MSTTPVFHTGVICQQCGTEILTQKVEVSDTIIRRRVQCGKQCIDGRLTPEFAMKLGIPYL